jgi:hypothetical protein
MSKFRLRDATVDDALWLAPRLREEDKQEIDAASGLAPEAALLASFIGPTASDTVTVAETDTGELFLIAGVKRTHPKMGLVWMLVTPLLERYALPSIRSSKAWLDEHHKNYPLLHNAVWEGNDFHKRWLRMLGFTFLRTTNNWRGQPFTEFARHRNV